MTRTKWAAMSPEERRIKLGVLTGECEYDETRRCAIEIDTGYGLALHKLDDYERDLNVTHEAVDRLTMQQKIAWAKALRKICLANKTSQYPTHWDDYRCVNATAAQRCEALALTLEPE